MADDPEPGGDVRSGRSRANARHRAVDAREAGALQKILEAILTSDFALLDQESKALGEVTKSSAWSVFYSPEYIRQSGAFVRAIDDLRDAAMGMDLDGAASSYVSLTLTCFQCHRYIKNKRIAAR